MPELMPSHRVCNTCKTPFTISVDEIAWYRAKESPDGRLYKLPGRCRPCRIKSRNNRIDQLAGGELREAS